MYRACLSDEHADDLLCREDAASSSFTKSLSIWDLRGLTAGSRHSPGNWREDQTEWANSTRKRTVFGQLVSSRYFPSHFGDHIATRPLINCIRQATSEIPS